MSQEFLDLSNLPDFIWEVTGKRAKNYAALNVQLEVKSEKFEQRLLVASEMRLYLLKQKPCKLESNTHYGDISAIKCPHFKKLIVGCEGKQFRLTPSEADSTFEPTLKQIFDYFSIIHDKSILDKKYPSLDLSSEVKDLLVNSMLSQDSNPHLSSPCGNLSTVYKARCDQMGVAFFEDVAWDIDAIYNSKNCRHFDVSDFDHLSPKQLIPLLASFENNSWFTVMDFSNLKLTPEMCGQLLRVFRENCCIQHILLSNTAVKSDYLMRMLQTLASNGQSSVHSFDLSHNPIDDKGLAHLIGFLSRSRSDLVSLNLSGLPLTHKTISSLADCFQGSDLICRNLTYLNLSHIPLRGEENSSLQSFLAHSNHLSTLKLSSTEYPLENFFAAALRGCSQHISTLDLSGCIFSRKSKETTPPSWKDFFSSVAALSALDLSGTKLPSSAVLSILEGLEGNSVVTNVSLNMSGCQLGQSNNISSALHQSLPSISKLKRLDISDNGLEHLLIGVFNSLASNKHLRELSVGRNVNNVKIKMIPAILEALVAMLQHENNGIERLEVDGMRMRQDATLLLNSLVTNNKLTHLDLTANGMGDAGMKMFSKSLLLNRKLASIAIDNNQITYLGLSHLASALEKNTTLQWIGAPLNDLLNNNNNKLAFEKGDRLWKKIEAHLHRNHSDHLASNSRQDFALEHWICNSFDQEVMNNRLAELSYIIEILDALKLKRRTHTYTDTHTNNDTQTCNNTDNNTCETHLDQATQVKKAFYEAKQIKKLFLDAYDFGEGKAVDDSKFTHQLGATIKDYVEWLTEQYDEKIKEDFPTTLAVNSLDELYKAGLTKEEERKVTSKVESTLQGQISDLKYSFLFNRALKFNDLLLNSALFSTEQAIFNAKGICSKVSKQMIKEGLLGEQDPEYVRVKGLIDSEMVVRRRSQSLEVLRQKEDEDEEDGQPQRLNSNKVRRPVSNYATNAEFSLVDMDDYTTPTSSKPTTAAETPPSTLAKMDLDSFEGAVSTPRLTHLSKERPRRMKNKPPSRPAQCSDANTGITGDKGNAVNMKDELASHKTKQVKTDKTTPEKTTADKVDRIGARDRFKGDDSNVTPTSSFNNREEDKVEDAKIPLPVIRSKNKGPELPPNRPKYTPKVAAPIPSPASTTKNVDSTPPQVPTPMRRQMAPGGRGLLVPSMDEIKAKRNTMKHVPTEMGSQPCLSTPSEKVKRLTDFSGLNDDHEEDKSHRGSKAVPPLPPKPIKLGRTNSTDSRNDDNSTEA